MVDIGATGYAILGVVTSASRRHSAVDSTAVAPKNHSPLP